MKKLNITLKIGSREGTVVYQKVKPTSLSFAQTEKADKYLIFSAEEEGERRSVYIPKDRIKKVEVLPMNKAVIFDLDGVLMNISDWHHQALNKALREVVNAEITKEEHDDKYKGHPLAEKLLFLMEEDVIQEEDTEEVTRLKQQYTVEAIEEFCEIDKEKIEMIFFLKKAGYKVGCVSNSPIHTTETLLRKLGVTDLLDVVISNEDFTNAKPDPECYLKAFAALDVEPENSIIVEDAPIGIEAAKQSGAEVLQVYNAHEVNKELFMDEQYQILDKWKRD